jgi:hypothetical protein
MDACKTVYCWVLALLVELARRNEKRHLCGASPQLA